MQCPFLHPYTTCQCLLSECLKGCSSDEALDSLLQRIVEKQGVSQPECHFGFFTTVEEVIVHQNLELGFSDCQGCNRPEGI